MEKIYILRQKLSTFLHLYSLSSTSCRSAVVRALVLEFSSGATLTVDVGLCAAIIRNIISNVCYKNLLEKLHMYIRAISKHYTFLLLQLSGLLPRKY